MGTRGSRHPVGAAGVRGDRLVGRRIGLPWRHVGVATPLHGLAGQERLQPQAEISAELAGGRDGDSSRGQHLSGGPDPGPHAVRRARQVEATCRRGEARGPPLDNDALARRLLLGDRGAAVHRVPGSGPVHARGTRGDRLARRRCVSENVALRTCPHTPFLASSNRVAQASCCAGTLTGTRDCHDGQDSRACHLSAYLPKRPSVFLYFLSMGCRCLFCGPDGWIGYEHVSHRS